MRNLVKYLNDMGAKVSYNENPSPEEIERITKLIQRNRDRKNVAIQKYKDSK